MAKVKNKFKVFGAALDAMDLSFNILVKQSYLQRKLQNKIDTKNDIKDPYEGFIKFSNILKNEKFEKIGKFQIESWLTPKPKIEDFPMITQEFFQKFTESDLIKEYSKKIANYIEERIFPDFPLMIGADHSLTGGVVNALSKKYGADNLNVLILDAHFDGIPAKIALELAKFANENKSKSNLIDIYLKNDDLSQFEITNNYTCGSFLQYLINEKLILPENLIIFGVQDYPSNQLKKESDERVKDYIGYYLSFEEKGVNFIPANENQSKMISQLKDILSKFDNKYFYLSLDVDVCTFKEVLASRFRNVIGIEGSVILSAVKVVKNYLDLSYSKLIGMDIMEIDTYMLNKKLEKSSRYDNTILLVDSILDILILG